MVLPDHRKFRFVLNDATVEVAGNLYQSVVGVAGHTTKTADVVRAVGATAVSATLTATAAAVDIYAEGIVHPDATPGIGYAYRIKRAMNVGDAHAAATSTGVLTVNLDAGETVQVALTTGTTMTFTRNRFHSILITAAPPTGNIVGVSPGVAAASRFYWSQVSGYASVLTDGTLYEGLPVQASIGTAGAVESYKRRVRSAGTTALVATASMAILYLVDSAGTTTGLAMVTTTAAATAAVDLTAGIAQNSPIVGTCVKVNATTTYSLVDLQINQN